MVLQDVYIVWENIGHMIVMIMFVQDVYILLQKVFMKEKICYVCEKKFDQGWKGGFPVWDKTYRLCDICDLKVKRFWDDKNKTCLLM